MQVLLRYVGRSGTILAAHPVTLESSAAVVSRSGNIWIDHVLTELNIPDREILLAHSPVMADNFPNGKRSEP